MLETGSWEAAGHCLRWSCEMTTSHAMHYAMADAWSACSLHASSNAVSTRQHTIFVVQLTLLAVRQQL